jgi:PAS domain S-box-containing protein
MSIVGKTGIEPGSNPSAAAASWPVSVLVVDAGGAADECSNPMPIADGHSWAAFYRGETVVRVILAAVLSMLAASEILAASRTPAPGNLPVLTQVAQIRRLPVEQSRLKYPVKLRGVITYSVPEWGVTFLQDSTAGIFLWGSPSLAKVRAGDLAEIHGRTAPGDFAPVVDQPQVQVLGPTRLPSAHRFTLEELFAGGEDSQWVEVRGIVHSVGLGQWIKPDLREATPSLVLEIAADGRKFDAWIGDSPKGTNYQDLVDKAVVVRGVCGTESNEKRQLVAVHLFVPKMEQVRVEERAGTSPDELVISPMDSLMQFTPSRASGHRIRVQGTVTLDLPGGRVFVQDKSGGVMVESTQNTDVEPGDRVDLMGFPISGKYEPVLEDAILRKIGRGTLPPPVDLTHATSLTGGHDAELVKIRGRLIDKSIQDKNLVLALQMGDLTYSARLESSAAVAVTEAITVGSLLEITGVLSIETPEYPDPTAFRILLRSPQDIIIIERTSWWTVSRIASLLVVLAAILLGSATWVALLRKRVEEQTETLRATLESTADGIVVVNSSGRIVTYNQKFAQMWAIPQSVVESGDHLSVLNFLAVRLEDPDAFLSRARQISGDREAQIDDFIACKDGRAFERHSEPQRIKGKSVGRVWGYRDITARKQAEQTLGEAEEHFRSLFASIPLPTFLFDAETLQYLEVNDAAASASGYSRNDFLKMRVTDLVAPEFAGQAVSRLEALRFKSLERSEGRYRLKDGSLVEVETDFRVLDFRGRRAVLSVSQDVTARRRAEEALRESEDRYRDWVESSSLLIGAHDTQGRILNVNRSAANYLESPTAEALVGRPLADFVPPELLGEFADYLTTILARGHAEGLMVLANPSGKRKIVEYRNTLRRQEGKEPIIRWTAQDVTGRVQAEEALRVSENRYRLLFERNLAGVLRATPEGRILDCNESMARMLGYDFPQELIGADVGQFWDDASNRARMIAKLGEQESLSNYEARFQRKDGKPVWVLINIQKTGPKGEDGASLDGTVVDITQRKEAEWQLNLQVTALKAAANGIVITDQKGQILWVNPAFTGLTGYSAGEVLGQTLRILKSGEQSQEFYRHLWQTILAGEVWTGELVNRRKDGTLYTDNTTITPVRDANGNLTHFVTVKQDVTERRRAERALEERTVYLNTLFEISPLGIVVLDTEGHIQMSNSKFEKLFLYSRGEIQGAKLDDILVPPELASEARSLSALCLGGGGAYATTRRRRKNGTLVDVEIFGVPLVIDGDLRGVLALYQDITDRMRAESDLVRYAEDLEVSKAAQEEHAQELARLVEELAHERDLLGTVMDNLPDFIFYKDRQSRLLRTNRAHAKMLGLSDTRQAVGKTDFDFFPEEDAEVYFRDERQVFETGQPLIGRIERVRQPDGQYRGFSTSKVPVRDAQGCVTGLVGIGRDITERMEAEEKIRESEEKYRSLVSNIPDVIWTVGADMRFAFISPNIERLSGFQLEEIYRRGAAAFVESIHPEEAGRVRKALEALFVKGDPYDVECRVRRKDGEWIWVHDRAVATYEKNGMRYADGLLSDITSSKQAEETLRASEERYRELFENASDIVYTTGLDTRLTSLNRVGQQVLGFTAEEITHLTLEQLVVPKHWERIKVGRERLLAGGTDFTLEVEVTTKGGRQVMLAVKPRLIYKGGKPVGVQGIARDITGRDEAELELRHAQKLESVGRLASGIAHEINTPIQFVGDNTRFVQESFAGLQTLLAKYKELRDAASFGSVSPGLLEEVENVEKESDCAYTLEEIPKALTQTLDGVTRVATIVRAMKEFAHPEGKEMAAADLNHAILSTLTVARNELKYVADVETEFGDLPMVVCNIGDINQVFLNLLVNAAHAIDEKVRGTAERGTIRVRTLSEGETICVSIADTGCGIPEAHRAKIFDPFFTTKEVGRGTGQGLAIARSVVVDRHKGTLTFESEVDKGTTFYVRLPIDPGKCSKERP